MGECLEAADEMASLVGPLQSRTPIAKPLDEDMIARLASEHESNTIEEGAIGGFASHVMQFLANSGAFDKGLKFGQ